MTHNSEFAIDPVTGDYTMAADGRPVTTNELTQAAYIRLRAHLGGWMHDLNLGSRLFKLENSKVISDETLIKHADRGLKPILDDGRASSIRVRVIEKVRYGRRIGVSIRDARTNLVTHFETIVSVG